MADTEYSIPKSLRMLSRSTIHMLAGRAIQVLDWYYKRTQETVAVVVTRAVDLRDWADEAPEMTKDTMRETAQAIDDAVEEAYRKEHEMAQRQRERAQQEEERRLERMTAPEESVELTTTTY
jgi:uncharacterized protein YjgD (DUF1641 family)